MDKCLVKLKNFKMKTIFFLSFFFLVTNVYCQKPCNKLPSTATLMQQLAKKPVLQIYPRDFLKGCNVTETMINRILYLLNWQWTEAEIEQYNEAIFDEYENIFNIKSIALKLANGNDFLYKQALDSLKKQLMPFVTKKYGESHAFRVDAGLVLLAGKLDIKSAIPKLNEALLDTIHYNKWALELALARLGNKSIEDKILNECKYDSSLDGKNWSNDFILKAKKLGFIATQKSIFKFVKWLDTAKYFARTPSGGVRVKSAAYVISFLSNIIQNEEFLAIIKPFKADYDDDFGQVTNNMIIQCREWLIKNKGKYILNRDGFDNF
jgi:hypothetical protein